MNLDVCVRMVNVYVNEWIKREIDSNVHGVTYRISQVGMISLVLHALDVANCEERAASKSILARIARWRFS